MEVKRSPSRCFISVSSFSGGRPLSTNRWPRTTCVRCPTSSDIKGRLDGKINSEMFSLTGSPSTMCPSACPSNPVQKEAFGEKKKRESKKTHALPRGRETAQKKERRCQGRLLSLRLQGVWKEYAKKIKKWILSASPAHTDARRRTPTHPQKGAIECIFFLRPNFY